MSLRAWCAALAVLAFTNLLQAQPRFRVEIEEENWPQAPALHSFACAEHNGLWVFIGGRSNGLHGFLPPLAFPNSGRNTDITLFDPATGQRWDQPVATLPDTIREAITTSNMQFAQRDSILYMVGGYGWNAGEATFITYPTLTAVHLPGLVQAIQNQQPIQPHFRQLRHDSLAVCGAHLARHGDDFLLVFGHLFNGIYDRSDTTGFHVQEYTHAMRRFRIQDQGGSLELQWLPGQRDTLEFRRRDYNLVPQRFPDGSHGHTAFAGVFQRGVNLPYTFPIDVWPDSLRPRHSFSQNLAHYHSAVLPVHDAAAKHMSSIFFGGEAMSYYDSSGTLRTDTLVPFVPTISIVLRDSAWQLSEHRADTSLPGLLGSNAQFFPDRSIDAFDPDGILQLDSLGGRTRVGWVMGGIASPAPHISDTDPAQSWASGRVFAVYLSPGPPSGRPDPKVEPALSISAHPSPFGSTLSIQLHAREAAHATLDLIDLRGNHVQRIFDGHLEGERTIQSWGAWAAGTYYLRLRSGEHMAVQRVLCIHD